MVHVLIPTQPDDTHAIYVKLAIEQQGHQATLWYNSDFPTAQTHSVELTNEHMHWYSNAFNTNDIDVVWMRRPSQPVLADGYHPADIKPAQTENHFFMHNLWHVISPSSVWINPVKNRPLANSKLLQLKIAQSINFKIPDTIFSNDPSHIKSFIKCYDSVIYKTIYPLAWFQKDEVRLMYTREITESDLPDDEYLQRVPLILQQNIEKAFEMRVVYMGGHCEAVKIDSQIDPRAKQDWRSAPLTALNLQRIELPQAIRRACREMMNKLGLLFGCFDLIVGKDNQVYFLEVNEQGQFLWIEDVNPDIKILDLFINFLINKGKSKSVTKRKNQISMRDFDEKVSHFMQQAVQNHKGSVLIR